MDTNRLLCRIWEDEFNSYTYGYYFGPKNTNENYHKFYDINTRDEFYITKEKFESMQLCTAKKDIDGILIFEGDKVFDVVTNPNGDGVVEWNNNEWIVKFENGTICLLNDSTWRVIKG